MNFFLFRTFKFIGLYSLQKFPPRTTLPEGSCSCFTTVRYSLLIVLQVFYQVVLESDNVVLCRVSLKTTMFVLIRDTVMCSTLLLVEWQKFVNISDVTNHPPPWEVTRDITAGHSRQWQTTVTHWQSPERPLVVGDVSCSWVDTLHVTQQKAYCVVVVCNHLPGRFAHILHFTRTR